MTAILAFYRFIVAAVVQFFDWLRKPGSKLKMLCGVLALACSVGAIDAFDQRNTVEQLRGQNLACKADVEGLRQELNTWSSRIDEVREEMEAADAEYQRQVAAARAIGLELAAEAEQARREAEVFQKRYESRPQECSAALELLDTTCKTLEGY